MDFFENTQPPSSCRHGIRRSVASAASADLSMERYVDASSMLSTSLGVTGVPPCRPSSAASRAPPPASGSAPRAARAPYHRIRQVRLVQVDAADPLAVLVCYPAGDADDNG